MPPENKKAKRSVQKAKSNDEVVVHIKLEQSEKAVAKCDKCGAFVNSETHTLNCGDPEKFERFVLMDNKSAKNKLDCELCPKKFRFKKSYLLHLKNEHSTTQNSVACNHCPARCPSKKILAEHVLKFHKQSFDCPHCGKKFARQAHVLRHIAQTGCGGLDTVFYPCEICKAKFTRKDNLLVHLRLQHILKREFCCKHCQYTTLNFSKLAKHWKIKHSKTPDCFQCDQCGKVTSSRAAMTKHLEIHGEKKFSCNVCNYTSHTVEVMRRHVLTHVDAKPFKCDLCPSSFIQRIQLDRHMEYHNFSECAVCSKAFKSRSKFLAHMKEHVHDGKLLCPFKDCPHLDKFSNKDSLDKHLETHVVKTYSCEVCKKTYNTEMNMRRHLATHTLDRARRCMYCLHPRAYVRGEQLARHVRVSHPAAFRAHLTHVRKILGDDKNLESGRVKRSEMEAVVTQLDAEAERIMEGCGGANVLYGGMQDLDDGELPEPHPEAEKKVAALMTEEQLSASLSKLLSHLLNQDTLECFGFPDETVDTVLEKVIEHCGARPADRHKWSRVQRLRENAKHLFLYVIEDPAVARMLAAHTIDQVVQHLLQQVDADEPRSVEVEIDGM